MSSTEESSSNSSFDGSVEETKKSEENELPKESFETIDSESNDSFSNDLSQVTDTSSGSVNQDKTEDIPAVAMESEDTEEGGEWTLLSGKVSTWIKENNFQLKGLLRPLLAFGVVLASIMALKVYGSILEAISHVPMAPRLFQLIGLLWIIYFSVTSLVRSEDRQELFSGLVRRWENFSGDAES